MKPRSIQPSLGLTDLRSPSTIAEELIGPPPDGIVIGMKFEPRPIIRVGIIGVGERGTSILDEFLGVDGVQITALCDIVKDKCLNAQRVIEKSGHETPALFFNGDHDFENLCKRDDVDFILHRDAVGLARPYGGCRNEERKARGRRSARGNDAEGMLGTGRYI